MTQREPAVAGMFYPTDPDELRTLIRALYTQALPVDDHVQPKALIVPHAGYQYSGPIAATAYAHLARWHDQFEQVVLIGPSHRVSFTGIASCSAEQFITPLGPIEVDSHTLHTLENNGMVRRIDQAHRQEHSLEVQLPFLQQSLDQFTLVPLVVGDASCFEVAQLLDWLWGGDETLLVISSDLSHYHTYAQAQEMDRFTSTAIEQLDSTLIHSDDACGSRPLKGLLLAAQEYHLQCQTIDLRNSGDTAGDQRRVVGYGAYLFH